MAAFVAVLTAVTAVTAATAGAQQTTRATVSKPTPGDSVDTSSTGPHSLQQALDAGLHLIGIYNADDGNWVAGATIRDTLGNETHTSKIGVAALDGLQRIAGYYLLEIEKPGYAPRHIMVQADSSAELMAALTPNPLGSAAQLAPVIVTAKRRLSEDNGLKDGFERRCMMGVIACVGRVDLDRHHSGGLDEELNHVPGIHRDCIDVSHGQVPTPALVAKRPEELLGCLIKMRTVLGGLCAPPYFLNGFEWDPLGGFSQAQLDQFLTSSNIYGIEVYKATDPRPARYQDPNYVGCGAIVIWTR